MLFSRLTILFLGATVGLAGCGGGTKWAPVDPPDQPGPFAVGYEAVEWVDADRADRVLPVEIWYPVDPADAEGRDPVTYPLGPMIGLQSEVAVAGAPVSDRQDQTLLVFSHGYGGISNQSIGLMEALASHGFVVASPEHTGNAQSSMTDDFDTAAANRVPDVMFVIDSMLARGSDAQDAFYQRLDPDRVGVVGHSFGGMTAIGAAAGWAGGGPDPRVAAIVPISAVIDGTLQEGHREGPNAGFTAEQLATIELPVMLLGGTADENVPIENNDLAFEQMSNAPVVYQVGIVGANHTHFASVCTIGDLLIEMGIGMDSWEGIGAGDLIAPYQATCTGDAFPIEQATRLQNLYVVAFFKLHLLGLDDYEQYLTKKAARREPAIDFRVRS